MLLQFMTLESIARKFLRNIRRLMLVCLDSIVILTTRTSISSSMLVVRLDNIGDFVIWLDSAQKLSSKYRNRRIILAANSVWSELANELGYWDEVWPIDTSKLINDPIYRWRIMRKVHQAGFELAIEPTFSRAFLSGDSLIRVSSAKERIASVSDLSNISAKDRSISSKYWYTKIIPASAKPLMELERNIEFLNGLCQSSFPPIVGLIPELRVDVSKFSLASQYFIVFPGASSSKRMWPVDRFAKLANAIHSATGLSVVVCGGKSELDLGFSFVDLATNNVNNLVGKTSLLELIEIIRGARILISNDTGAVHIAASVETESVCIFGDLETVHLGRFMPYSSNVFGLKPIPVYEPSLESITVESVQKTALELFDRI